MKRLVLIAALLTACLAAPAAAQTQCQPAGFDRAQLDALKAAEWVLPDTARRNALARAMTDCLANPDPTLRDGIAFEALQHWLRSRALSDATMLALADDLEARLQAPEGAGFERPFAALVLAEVARADRIEAFLAPARRARLLEASLAYLANVRDYRGFDEREGWRHGVAHGADLMLQLGLNPAFGKAELARIRDAIAAQIAPAGHFYIYGESERLARPIVFIAQRGLFSEQEWSAYFAALAPAEGENLFASQAGLARRHNTIGFLALVAAYARLTESSADDILLPGVEAALRATP